MPHAKVLQMYVMIFFPPVLPPPFSLSPNRLAPGSPGCFGILVAAAADRNLLVSVLPTHMLLLRELPLLPRSLLLPESL